MSFDMNKLMQQAAQMQEQMVADAGGGRERDGRGLRRRRHGEGDRERRGPSALDHDLDPRRSTRTTRRRSPTSCSPA